MMKLLNILACLSALALVACGVKQEAPDLVQPKPPVVSSPNPNVLLICVDDLRPELKSFGVDYIQSPNIDRLAASGRAFHRHYVNSPTCGASRYTLLTGRYGPRGNKALMNRAEQMLQQSESVTPSMPEWFRQQGYTTVSVGKISHHPGGLSGQNWNDPSKVEMPEAWDRSLMPAGPWKTPVGVMWGLANGVPRVKGETPAIEAVLGPDKTYPDGWISEEGIRQLEILAAEEKPFFLAIGLMKPHLPFAMPAKYLESYQDIELPPIPHSNKPDWRTTWQPSGEFFNQYIHHGKDPREDAEYADAVRRHYAGCVTYIDQKVGEILDQLQASGQADNTIVVLWGDHGWHLGEHAVWGKHTLFEESLRAPLIISTPAMVQGGEKSEAVVETVDIFPTLSELAGLPHPDFSDGKSLLPQLTDPELSGRGAFGYHGKARTLRTDTHRLILHHDGYMELYDHTAPEKETKNLAEAFPELCEELKIEIANRESK